MNTELPNIEKVEVLPDYALRVKFRRRGWKNIRLVGFLAREQMMAPIRKQVDFRKVKVIDWGGAVGWPDGVELGASTLWRMAEEQTPVTSADFSAWQKR